MGEKPSEAANGRKARSAAPRRRVGRPKLKPDEISALFARLQAKNPDPKGELDYVNPYTLLVAVALSAQATDAGVNRATKPLFASVDNPAKMLALGEARLKEAIRSLGFFNMKAKNVIRMAEILVAEHGGVVPREREALERLPGVGRKTASVVRNIAFGEPEIAVDTHIFRVSNRTGLAPGATADAVADTLATAVPEPYRLHAHHWLILHGRYVCKARLPECWRCPAAAHCNYGDKVSALG